MSGLTIYGEKRPAEQPSLEDPKSSLTPEKSFLFLLHRVRKCALIVAQFKKEGKGLYGSITYWTFYPQGISQPE